MPTDRSTGRGRRSTWQTGKRSFSSKYEAEPETTLERQIGTGSGRLHAGDGVQVLQNLAAHRGNYCRAIIPASGERCVHGEHVVRVKTGGDAVQRSERADEQAGAN